MVALVALCVYIYNSYELMTADENAMFLLGNTLLCVLHNIYYVSCVMYIHYKIIVIRYIMLYLLLILGHLSICELQNSLRRERRGKRRRGTAFHF